MRPVPPVGGDRYAQARTMGEALAAIALDDFDPTSFGSRLEVAAVGMAIQMPELQVRFVPGWRWSPLLVRALGVNNQAWIQMVRLGELVLVGFPADFGAECAVPLKRAAQRAGYALWTLSFNGDYVGYISPDRYYHTASADGTEGYEMYRMSWCGPQQEQYLSVLARRMVRAVTRGG
jgi:hypothetical protein